VAGEPGGAAVVLDHGAGWTTIVAGLATVTATAGRAVTAGQALGAAAGGAAGLTFEVWRGRHAVDPLLLLRRGPSPLAAAPPLP
jgi:murein DD-endopeptidase MepM/ murein hydrolase activator NlpD